MSASENVVAVLTPTLGRSHLLELAVASVEALPFAKRHVLICPGSERVRLREKFPQLEIVVDNNEGLYAALNRGLAKVAEAECVTYLNDDDLLDAPGLGAAWAQLRALPGCGAVYGRVRMIDGGGRFLGWIPVAHAPRDLGLLIRRGIVPLAQPGTLLKREVFTRIGGFDESYRLAGDLEFFSRALAAGERFSFFNGEVASFRFHADQLSKREDEAMREKWRLAKQLGSLPGRYGWLPRWRFLFSNAGVYADRIRRHGFKRMGTLYRHV